MTGQPLRHPVRPDAKSPEQSVAESRRVVDVQTLLAGRREVWIEHGGVRYCLCLTRRNRLILRK